MFKKCNPWRVECTFNNYWIQFWWYQVGLLIKLSVWSQLSWNACRNIESNSFIVAGREERDATYEHVAQLRKFTSSRKAAVRLSLVNLSERVFSYTFCRSWKSAHLCRIGITTKLNRTRILNTRKPMGLGASTTHELRDLVRCVCSQSVQSRSMWRALDCAACSRETQ